MMYDQNKIANHGTDEAKAIRIELEDAKAAEKNISAEIAAAIAAGDNSTDDDANLEDLLNGNIITTPTPAERINSLHRRETKGVELHRHVVGEAYSGRHQSRNEICR